MRRWNVVLVGLLGVATAFCSRDRKQLAAHYIASGDKYTSEGKLQDAAIQYRNAVAQDSMDPRARGKLAATYEARGDLRNALAEYVRAADLAPDDVNFQLHAGKLLIAAGKFPEAKARALAVLEKEPKNVNGLIVFGNALSALKDVDGAIKQVQAAVDAEPSLTFGYTNLAMLELKKGDRSAAEAAFKRAVDVAPDSISARLNLGNLYWASGDLTGAEREMKSALAVDSKSASANQMLATFYLVNRKRSEAEPYLKAYAAAAPGPLPQTALADYYLEQKRQKEAVEILEHLKGEKDGLVPATLRLAALDFQAGQRQKAYDAVEQALKQVPRDESLLETKARFLIADAKFDDALKIVTTVTDANPQAVTSHYLRGVAFSGKGALQSGIASFRKVLELVPSATTIQVQLAALYVRNGQAKDAAQLLGPVLRAQPNLGIAHLLMGEALLLDGNVTGAERELLPLAAANPNSSETQAWIGRLWGTKGDKARARQAFEKSLSLNSASFAAFNGLVSLDLVDKKFDAVQTRLESRLKGSPNDPATLFLAANSYLAMNNVPRAEALLTQLITVDPSNFDAYGKLGYIYASERRLDEAKAKFDAAAAHQERPVAAKTITGMILELQGKPEEARKSYQAALALDPTAAVAANNLAWQYAEMGGNLDQALNLAQAAKAKLPENSQISDTLGWIYLKKDLATLAIGSLEQAARQNPTSPTVRYHLGLAYLKNSDESKARRELQEALNLRASFNGADDARRVLAKLGGTALGRK